MNRDAEKLSQEMRNQQKLKNPEPGDIWQERIFPRHVVLAILPSKNVVIAEYVHVRDNPRQPYRVALDRAKEITPHEHQILVMDGGSFKADVRQMDKSVFRSVVMYWQNNWDQAYLTLDIRRQHPDLEKEPPPPAARPNPVPPKPEPEKDPPQFKHKLLIDDRPLARLDSETRRVLLDAVKHQRRLGVLSIVDGSQLNQVGVEREVILKLTLPELSRKKND